MAYKDPKDFQSWYARNRERVLARMRAYHAQNRERLLEQRRKKYAANKDQTLQRNRIYRTINRDRVLKQRRDYYTLNKEAIKAQNRKYWAENRDQLLKAQRIRRENNREKIRLQSRKHYARNRARIKEVARARKYGMSVATLRSQLQSRNGKCDACGRRNQRLFIDHCHNTNGIRGFICRSCNTALGNMKDDVALLSKLTKYAAKFALLSHRNGAPGSPAIVTGLRTLRDLVDIAEG